MEPFVFCYITLKLIDIITCFFYKDMTIFNDISMSERGLVAAPRGCAAPYIQVEQSCVNHLKDTAMCPLNVAKNNTEDSILPPQMEL